MTTITGSQIIMLINDREMTLTSDMKKNDKNVLLSSLHNSDFQSPLSESFQFFFHWRKSS